jgi:hypothetical protein
LDLNAKKYIGYPPPGADVWTVIVNPVVEKAVRAFTLSVPPLLPTATELLFTPLPNVYQFEPSHFAI